MALLKTGGGWAVPNWGTFSRCCGSRYRTDVTSGDIPARRWKNQYGEGITPAKKGSITRHIDNGILLCDGLVGKEMSNDKHDVKHLKTKNGDITIAIRKVW